MNFAPETHSFLRSHRISVLTVLMDDGAPHSASLHYAWDEKTGKFIFFTRSRTVKFQALKSGAKKASMVIGFSDEEFCTVQMRGEARACDATEAKQVYCEKFRHILEFLRDADAAFLEFVPDWYRYTDIKQHPAIKYSSED